jgi:hypothetical protein
MKYKLEVQYEFQGEWWEVWQSADADTIQKFVDEMGCDDLEKVDTEKAIAMRVIQILN